MKKVRLSELRKGAWFIDYSGEVYRKGEAFTYCFGFYAVYGVTPGAVSSGCLSAGAMVSPFPKTRANKALIQSLFDKRK